MHYIRRKSVVNPFLHYLIGSTKVPKVRTIRDLGIVFDLLSKFAEHTRIVLGRIWFILSRIKRALLKFNVIFFNSTSQKLALSLNIDLQYVAL